MAKFFFDFEFVPELLVPLSVGIVAEDGESYYAEFWEGFGKWDANPFITEYVRPHLGKVPSKWNYEIEQEILEFVASYSIENQNHNHQFWAWYGAYDWVLMTRLIGNQNFQHTPPNWPKYHMDLKQLAVSLNVEILPTKLQPEHHALSDALWNKLVWEFLMTKDESNG